MKAALALATALLLSACGTYGGARYDYPRAGKAGGDTVLICHKGKKTMELPRSAVNAHMSHGDYYGRC